MKLITLTDDIVLDPDDISSVQREKVDEYTPSGAYATGKIKWLGSVMTLKNGRKIFVKDMTPLQIHDKIKSEQATCLQQEN